jgi:hypothetical protein
MPVTPYLRVLAHELRSYRARGWTFVRYLWPLRGQYLIQKVWKG